MVISYIYATLKPKFYKTEIVLRDALSTLFVAYKYLSYSVFVEDFKVNITSLDNLILLIRLKKTEIEFRKKLILAIEDDIDTHTNNLEIAKKLI